MDELNELYKPVFAITLDADLGVFIEPFAVLLTNNGSFSYRHYRINKQTLNDYNFIRPITQSEKELLILCELFLRENIMKRFDKNARNQKQFFSELPNSKNLGYIRNSIQLNVLKCLSFIQKNQISLHFKGKSTSTIIENPLKIYEQRADVVFNFRKEKDFTKYYLSIKLMNEIIHLKGKSHLLLTDKPCWLIIENRLMSFEEGFDSKKLLPFFEKDAIIVPSKLEENYYKTFVFNAIKKFNIDCSGFEIREVYPQAKAMLILDLDIDLKPIAILHYIYDTSRIEAGKATPIVLTFENGNNGFVFQKLHRNQTWECSIENCLLNVGFKMIRQGVFAIENNSDAITTNDFIAFINHNAFFFQENDIGIEQKITDKRIFFGKSELKLQVNKAIDWFDINITVEFGEFKFPFVRLAPYILQKIEEFPLPNGEIAIIPKSWFSDYSDFLESSVISPNNNLKLKTIHYNILNAIAAKIHDTDYPDAIKILENFEIPEIPSDFNATLRPYQLQGYAWLIHLNKLKFGACLADDMGLGKTIQTLCFLAKLRELKPESIQNSNFETQNKSQLDLFEPVCVPDKKNCLSTTLIIMPLSLVYNWEDEIIKFFPKFRVLKYAGNSRKEDIKKFCYHDIILSTYGVIRNDIELLKDIRFGIVILDESHLAKNPESKIYQSLMLLQAEQRIVLTGTPIENSLNDLWAQMNFINPGLLGSNVGFREKYLREIEKNGNEKRQNNLKTLIEPYILRRTKEKVAKDLPPLTEKIHYCEMTEEQRQLYEEKKTAIRNFLLKSISSQGMDKSRFMILKGLTQLRLLASHPKMIEPEATIESGKFNEILRNLENLINENHKALFFSQFVKHLNLFEQYFIENGIPYTKIIGNMSIAQRKEMVEQFQQDADKRVFLISMKAGGFGLNLTSADYVFVLDPWWNPAVENQAINRAYRIGQDKKVFAYKFITKESVEDKIYILQQKKLHLAETFINSNNPLSSLNNSEIFELFR